MAMMTTDGEDFQPRARRRTGASPDMPWTDPALPSPQFRTPRGPLTPRTDPSLPNRDPNFTTPTPGYAPANNGGVAGGRTPQMPQFGGNRYDPNYIQGMIGQWANLPGADPSLRSDPAYWQRRIGETGGLGPDNEDYWKNMGLENYRRPANYHSQGQSQGGSNPLGLMLQLLGSRLQQPQQTPQMSAPATPQAEGAPSVNLEDILRRAMGQAF